jgi:molecular chaperone GrpE
VPPDVEYAIKKSIDSRYTDLSRATAQGSEIAIYSALIIATMTNASTETRARIEALANATSSHSYTNGNWSDFLPSGDALRGMLDGIAAAAKQQVEENARLRAEFENFRKRASREAMELRERAQGQLLAELLPVLDNLERALDAAEHHDEGKVLGGVRMTRDMFVELLRRAGVEEIKTVGQPFDPNVHDAIVLQPSDQEEGTVTAVLERGYRQGDHILRPARVAVSSGPAGQAGGRD